MDFRKIELGWTGFMVALEREQWTAFANMVMNLRVS
jgi:hypothetical protein